MLGDNARTTEKMAEFHCYLLFVNIVVYEMRCGGVKTATRTASTAAD